MTEPGATLLARLADIVGGANVLTAAADVAPHTTDWRGRYRGAARAVVRPATTAEVAAVVAACADARVPVVPQGGNTGLCGGATPHDVGHVQAHGLGTIGCDQDESRALKNVLGDAWERVPVTAAKSYFGHVGAGSALLELVAGVLALKEDNLFPILNYDTPDPDCPVRAVTAFGSPGRSFLNPSVTPQGQASCVYVRRFD